jgi:hypothetical protein
LTRATESGFARTLLLGVRYWLSLTLRSISVSVAVIRTFLHLKLLAKIWSVFTKINITIKPRENSGLKRKVTTCILENLEKTILTLNGIFYISVNKPHKSSIIGFQFRKLYHTF